MLFLDRALTAWLNAPAGPHPAFDAIVIAVTNLTIPVLIIIIGSSWWWGRERHQDRVAALEAGFAFLLGLAVNQMILIFVSRLRPYDAGLTHLIIAPSADSSFPSDHATAAAAIVASMALNARQTRSLVLSVPVALLMVSRVYVGTHYVSDVIGGMGTGWLAALLVHQTASLRKPLDSALVKIL